MTASTLYFNMATHAADNTEKRSVNTTRMVISHCDLSHENVASCDQARISACATCFRLALSLRVTRCGRHVSATCLCDLSLRVTEPLASFMRSLAWKAGLIYEILVQALRSSHLFSHILTVFHSICRSTCICVKLNQPVCNRYDRNTSLCGHI